MSEHEQQEKAKVRGFWSVAFKILLTPVAILTITAVASIVFGGRQGLGVGLLLLWCISMVVIPPLFFERLSRRFGAVWGTIIVLAPWWLPVVIALVWLTLASR
jgi:hypothetical protein